MPASRAVGSGSPFLTVPERISRSAWGDIAIVPRAIASRLVTGLSPTSTIFTRPRASTWDRAVARPAFPAGPALPALLFFAIALRQEKREAFERHGQVDTLQL